MPDRRRHSEAKISPRIWIGLALAYLVAVPWYAPRDWIDPTLWALPVWAVVSVVGSLTLAIGTARALFAAWPNDDADDAGTGRTGGDRDARSANRGAP